MEECSEEGIGLWWGKNIIKYFSIQVMEPGNLILYFCVAMAIAWPFLDLLSSLKDVSIQYPRLSSRSGETEKCFTSDYIVHRKNYFTIPILSQFSIRPSVQWRRNEMCHHSLTNKKLRKKILSNETLLSLRGHFHRKRWLDKIEAVKPVCVWNWKRSNNKTF